MGEIFNRYMAEIAPQKAPRTYQDNQAEIKNLQGVFGEMLPESIKPKHVYAYLDKRGKTASTRANREIALLSHVFSMAIRWGIVETNPCRDIKKISTPKRNRYVTDAEFLAVKEAGNETIRHLMDFAYLTALRIGDILEIHLSDLQNDGILIEINKSRRAGMAAKRILIEWTPELRELVERIRSQNKLVGGLHLFHGRSGKPYTRSGIQSMFRSAKLKTDVEDFHFHDIRAKALTDAKQLGMDAQRLAGHASIQMTEHYIKRRTVERITPIQERIKGKAGG